MGEREGGRKRLYTFPSATNKAALPTSVGHLHHSGVKHCNKQEAQTYPQQNVGYRTFFAPNHKWKCLFLVMLS